MGKAGWFLISVGLITLTVLVCAWLGRPIPLDITFKQDTSGDDLDLERIHETITHLSSGPSRLSGSPGADEAAAYIQQRLAASTQAGSVPAALCAEFRAALDGSILRRLGLGD